MSDSDSFRAVAKRGKARLWQKRWATVCRDCGESVIFLDNSQPAKDGQKWRPFVEVELYGTVNGEPAPWQGEIAFDPTKHARHVCVRQKRRIAWLIRQSQDDI